MWQAWCGCESARKTREPLYPFGYGLSYTTFKYSNLKLSSTTLVKDGTAIVRVDVTNSGAMPGDEVVQMYVKHPQSKVSRPAS